jgi:hypothetical protein
MHVSARPTRLTKIGLIPWLCLALGLLASCKDIEPIPANVCGNHVLEAGEECDDFPSDWCQAPGSANPCRINCRLHECPVGAGCSADSVCSTPSGRFGPAAFAVGDFGLPLDVGDMDGDLRDELIAGGLPYPTHAMFAADATVKSIVSVTLGDENLAVGSLNGDARDDLVGWSSASPDVKVLHADVAGVLWPVSHIVAAPEGSSRRVFSVDHLGDGRPEPVLLVDTHLHLVPASGREHFTQLLYTAVSAGEVAGQIPTGDFDHRNACGEFVLAGHGAPRVHVYAMCNPVGPAAEVATIELPTGSSVGSRGAFSGDYNDDDLADLLVVTNDDTPRLVVAYGVGDGSFHSNLKTLPVAQGDNRFSPIPVANGEEAEVLAVADLDADGRLDLITQNGALLNMSDGEVLRWHEYWVGAAAADFNRDGTLDVIGVPPGRRELTFWMGIGAGEFNAFSIPTRGIPAPLDTFPALPPVLSVGDFDGDLTSDLAFAEQLGRGDDQSDLTVLFGKALSVPTDQRQVSSVSRVLDLCAGSLFPDKNKLSDLVMLADDVSASGVGMFAGQTNRLLFSPLALPADAATRADLTLLQVLLGRFLTAPLAESAPEERRDHMVMLAKTLDDKLLLYFVANGKDGFDSATVDELPLRLPEDVLVDQTVLAAVDVDDDGVDEVLVSPLSFRRGRYPYYVARRSDLRFTVAGFATEVRGVGDQRLTIWPQRSTAPRAPLSYDVNADGRLDLTLSVYGDGGNYEIVFPGADTGRLGEGTAFPVEEFRPTTYLNVDDDPELEMAVAGEFEINVFDLDFAGAKLVPLFTLVTNGWVYDLTTGDFDGNGVADLASSSDEVEMFFGEAKKL